MFTYSFIIPHHNSPDLLNRCLDSIPQRSDIQIIVVDDNSNEELRPKIYRSDVELLYIDAEHTKGAGHARNVGLEKAKGKWLLFADSDDHYAENFIDILDQYKTKDVDVLYFNYRMIDESGRTVYTKKLVQPLLEHGPKDKNEEEYLQFRNNEPWNKMVKRYFVETNKINFEETPNGNDILYSLKLGLFSHKFLFVPYRLYYYIKHSNSISTRKQSVKDIVCRLEHNVQKYVFNRGIGHSEWNSNILLLLYETLYGHGFTTCFKVITQCLFHLMTGKFRPCQWIAMVRNE